MKSEIDAKISQNILLIEIDGDVSSVSYCVYFLFIFLVLWLRACDVVFTQPDTVKSENNEGFLVLSLVFVSCEPFVPPFSIQLPGTQF